MQSALESVGRDDDLRWDSLYFARGDEVSEHRPIFTGDVFQRANGERYAVLQHPCAIRLNGVDLAKTILAAPVERTKTLLPSQWETGYFKEMPLPEVDETGKHFSIKFVAPIVVERENLVGDLRIACLAPEGVNLLMQRWVHHNTRFVVPTWEFHNSIIEQYEEADLVQEWIEARVDAGVVAAEASSEAHEWLRGNDASGQTRQSLLGNSQAVSRVRREMRLCLRELFRERG